MLQLHCQKIFNTGIVKVVQFIASSFISNLRAP